MIMVSIGKSQKRNRPKYLPVHDVTENWTDLFPVSIGYSIRGLQSTHLTAKARKC